jgi:hypothetical protein
LPFAIIHQDRPSSGQHAEGKGSEFGPMLVAAIQRSSQILTMNCQDFGELRRVATFISPYGTENQK